jgi:hypothetical protein
MGNKGNVNKKTLKNLTAPPKSGAEWNKIGVAAIKRKASIRKRFNEALLDGFAMFETKDVELLDEAGNVLNIQFASARIKVPTDLDLALIVIDEARKRDAKFMQIAINMNENYENRKIKASNKSANAQQGLVDHINSLKVGKVLEIPVTPYEDYGRTPE